MKTIKRILNLGCFVIVLNVYCSRPANPPQHLPPPVIGHTEEP